MVVLSGLVMGVDADRVVVVVAGFCDAGLVGRQMDRWLLAGHSKGLLHHLQSHMGDLEPVMQFIRGVFEEHIVGVALGHHQVRGQGDV